jgi:hypothetical protein
MSFLIKVPFCICIAAVFLFSVPSLLPQQAHPRPTTIVVEKVGGHVIYRVGTVEVKDLLRALNQVADRSGSNQPVNVIVDSRLPCAEIWNIDGVAGKARLTNLRFFVFFHETQMMTEIKRMSSVPYSTSPEN